MKEFLDSCSEHWVMTVFLTLAILSGLETVISGIMNGIRNIISTIIRQKKDNTTIK